LNKNRRADLSKSEAENLRLNSLANQAHINIRVAKVKIRRAKGDGPILEAWFEQTSAVAAAARKRVMAEAEKVTAVLAAAGAMTAMSVDDDDDDDGYDDDG